MRKPAKKLTYANKRYLEGSESILLTTYVLKASYAELRAQGEDNDLCQVKDALDCMGFSEWYDTDTAYVAESTARAAATRLFSHSDNHGNMAVIIHEHCMRPGRYSLEYSYQNI